MQVNKNITFKTMKSPSFDIKEKKRLSGVNDITRPPINIKNPSDHRLTYNLKKSRIN